MWSHGEKTASARRSLRAASPADTWVSDSIPLDPAAPLLSPVGRRGGGEELTVWAPGKSARSDPMSWATGWPGFLPPAGGTTQRGHHSVQRCFPQ